MMAILSYEFKAKVTDLEAMEARLLALNPVFKGEDQQTDTYFNITSGRLKLREGNVENALIHYERKNIAGAKTSTVLLYEHNPSGGLKEILSKSIGVKVVVAKTRRIYFIDNVKFHFDKVDGLGTFMEVEAIDKTGETGIEHLKEQCRYYSDMFGVKSQDYISLSYSDLLLDAQSSERTSE